jgi:hypothetical protein
LNWQDTVHLPLSIDIAPSRRLVFVMVCAHALALLAVTTLTFAMPLRAALGLLVLVSLQFVLCHLRSQPVVRLFLGIKGELEIEETIDSKVGARETAEILPETTLFPGLILLAWRSNGQRHVRVVLADSTGADDLRRLRVWLGWRARASDA